MRLKRLAAPKWWPIERKTKKFVIAPRGPHQKELSLPLLVILRDVLKLVETNREARSIIKKGEIFVDGKKRKDPKHGVGPMDIIEIPSISKSWRAVPQNGLKFVETKGDDSKLKICKILDKRVLKGGKIQLNLDGGKNILTSKKVSTNDSLLIEIPSQKIVKHIKFDKGSLVLITSGKKAGKISTIKEIEKQHKRVWLEDGGEVSIKSIIVVGKETPLIKLK